MGVRFVLTQSSKTRLLDLLAGYLPPPSEESARKLLAKTSSLRISGKAPGVIAEAFRFHGISDEVLLQELLEHASVPAELKEVLVSKSLSYHRESDQGGESEFVSITSAKARRVIDRVVNRRFFSFAKAREEWSAEKNFASWAAGLFEALEVGPHGFDPEEVVQMLSLSFPDEADFVLFELAYKALMYSKGFECRRALAAGRTNFASRAQNDLFGQRGSNSVQILLLSELDSAKDSQAVRQVLTSIMALRRFDFNALQWALKILKGKSFYDNEFVRSFEVFVFLRASGPHELSPYLQSDIEAVVALAVLRMNHSGNWGELSAASIGDSRVESLVNRLIPPAFHRRGLETPATRRAHWHGAFADAQDPAVSVLAHFGADMFPDDEDFPDGMPRTGDEAINMLLAGA